MSRTLLTGGTVARAGIVLALLLASLGFYAGLPDATEALLLGVGSGCLVSAIGLSVVLTYRGSGVVNLASGAMAMFIAYSYDALRRDGTFFPLGISLGQGLDLLPALLIAMVLAALLGLACHFIVFRPLRNAPPLAKVIASVGIFIVLQAIVILRYASAPRPIQRIFTKAPIKLPNHITLPQDEFILLAIIVCVSVLLWSLFRFSRFGLASRAAAENEKGAVILGFSPDRLAGTNWVLSTVVVGLLGVLVATVNGSVDPTTISLLIVPALGAALLGGFTSFGVTVTAGLGIAMAQSLLQFMQTKSWFPHTDTGPIPGVREALPFMVIVVALFLRGSSLPTRASLVPGRLPFVPRSTMVPARSAFAVMLAASGLLLFGPEWRLAITNTVIAAVICLSFVVVTGFVGQISLAQMVFAGLAAFTLSKLSTSYGVPFPLGPLLGAALATLFGLVAAVPALRVRGVNLAVVTLAAAVAIENVVFRNDFWAGGAQGANIASPQLFGLRFGPIDSGSVLGYHGDGKLPNPFFGLFCLIVLLALGLLVVNLRRSASGRRMLAVRSNERAAAAVGINVAATKLLAFGLASFIAGLGGALSGYRFGSASPEFFGSSASLMLLAFAYLGGVTSVTGAVLAGCIVGGGLFFTALRIWFGIGDDYVLLLGGLGLIVTAVLNPEGMAGAYRQMWGRVIGLTRGLRRVPSDSLGAVTAASIGDR